MKRLGIEPAEPAGARTRLRIPDVRPLGIPAEPRRMETRVLPFNDDGIAEAARLILAGEPVAIATETVYGLAADATNAEAVARIYEAKGRPSFNPLIVHVPDFAAAERIGQFDERLGACNAHWPGR